MDLMRTGDTAASPTHAGAAGVRAPRLQGAFAGVLVALSAAAGLVVGLRSVVALDLGGVRPLLRLPVIPREGMGIEWTSRVVWPAQLQGVALERLSGVIVGLFLAAMAVALLNTLVLLAEAGASRRREVAVRAALGAPPGALLRLFVGDVRRLITLALTMGLLLGLTAGGALRGLWPGELVALAGLDAAGTVALGLLCVAGVAALAYVWVGLTLGRSVELAAELGAGERATDDPAAIFRRRALSALQMGAAGSVAMASIALALAVRAPSGAVSSVSTTVIPVTAPSVTRPGGATGGSAAPAAVAASGAAWQTLLARLAKLPGLEAESVATPGTLVGLGVRDYATAQCGMCFNGEFLMPLWSVVADHFSVGPGYFALAGRRVVSGRGLTAADGPSAERVAVVNQTFARTAFEKGDPLGHMVHLGHGLEAWYEVVGVVADESPAVVGRGDVPRSQVFVSVLQQPLRHARVLLRGEPGTVRAATSILAAAGYAPGAPRSVVEVRHAAAAPLSWTGRVALALGLVTLLLALQGAHATALQVSRRRLRELAVRRALGAADLRMLLFVLGGSARGALWGSAVAVFFGALFVALLQKVAAGVPSPGPEAYVAMAALLVASSLLASLKAAREALTVTPAEALA